MLAGETDIGKTMLRDYINATIGFQDLGADIDKTPESLMHMLSATGNPRTNHRDTERTNLAVTILDRKERHYVD